MEWDLLIAVIEYSLRSSKKLQWLNLSMLFGQAAKTQQNFKINGTIYSSKKYLHTVG